MTLTELTRLLSAYPIHAFYEEIAYSYSSEIANHKTGLFKEERESFLLKIDWKQQPHHEIILRLFNQINSYYCEQLVYENKYSDPIDFLEKANAILLFLQEKPLGLRKNDISFGVRKNIDRMDPISRYKWFYGIGPDYLMEVLESLHDTVVEVSPSVELAIIFMMVVICIHPFFDGNGRAARMFFTWLNMKWELGENFINEDLDGEFLRVGQNINSTEYIMGSFNKVLCNGFNQVPYLYGEFKTKENDKFAAESLIVNLKHLKSNNSYFSNEPAFMNLVAHFQEIRQVIPYSPRFNSLRNYII